MELCLLERKREKGKKRREGEGKRDMPSIKQCFLELKVRFYERNILTFPSIFHANKSGGQ